MDKEYYQVGWLLRDDRGITTIRFYHLRTVSSVTGRVEIEKLVEIERFAGDFPERGVEYGVLYRNFWNSLRHSETRRHDFVRESNEEIARFFEEEMPYLVKYVDGYTYEALGFHGAVDFEGLSEEQKEKQLWGLCRSINYCLASFASKDEFFK